jgi:hypothetical protein
MKCRTGMPCGTSAVPVILRVAGGSPPLLAVARTPHRFDPCDLLLPNERSEILPGHRERQ